MRTLCLFHEPARGPTFLPGTWHLAPGTPQPSYAARGSPYDQAPSNSTPTMVDTPGSSIVTP